MGGMDGGKRSKKWKKKCIISNFLLFKNKKQNQKPGELQSARVRPAHNKNLQGLQGKECCQARDLVAAEEKSGLDINRGGGDRAAGFVVSLQGQDLPPFPLSHFLQAPPPWLLCAADNRQRLSLLQTLSTLGNKGNKCITYQITIRKQRLMNPI